MVEVLEGEVWVEGDIGLDIEFEHDGVEGGGVDIVVGLVVFPTDVDRKVRIKT